MCEYMYLYAYLQKHIYIYIYGPSWSWEAAKHLLVGWTFGRPWHNIDVEDPSFWCGVLDKTLLDITHRCRVPQNFQICPNPWVRPHRTWQGPSYFPARLGGQIEDTFEHQHPIFNVLDSCLKPVCLTNLLHRSMLAGSWNYYIWILIYILIFTSLKHHLTFWKPQSVMFTVGTCGALLQAHYATPNKPTTFSTASVVPFVLFFWCLFLQWS